MTATALRRELPPLPARMRSLPVDHRGYPVPWFVTWLEDRDGQPTPVHRGEGEPDFRVIIAETIEQAVKQRRCWVCGGKLGRHMSFVIGPMCAVNRNSAEPPSHFDCAVFSARACPFLTRPHMRRNTARLPEGAGPEHTAGVMLERNPGVTLVWTTARYHLVGDGRGGLLFNIGKPEHVRWYCEGRPATRVEVEESIASGLPALEKLAAEQEGALDELAEMVKRAQELLPDA